MTKTRYLNYAIEIKKASNGAHIGTVRAPDGATLTIEPAETAGRALVACKTLADRDMAERVEAVARGERH